MPTYICVSCKQTIPLEGMRRDAGGQTYDAACFQALSSPLPLGSSTGTGLVISDVRVPFSTVFTVVSQVLGVIAMYSVIGWLFVACWGAVSHLR